MNTFVISSIGYCLSSPVAISINRIGVTIDIHPSDRDVNRKKVFAKCLRRREKNEDGILSPHWIPPKIISDI